MLWSLPGTPGYYFWGAKAATLSAFIALLGLPQAGHILPIVYVLASTIAASSLATLVSIAHRQYTLTFKFFGLLAQAGLLILAFASLYADVGLASSAHPDGQREGFAISLYFSVVTWTTTGYGDFVAPRAIRLIAALEAIVGYGYFGIIVGLMAGRINAARQPL